MYLIVNNYHYIFKLLFCTFFLFFARRRSLLVAEVLEMDEYNDGSDDIIIPVSSSSTEMGVPMSMPWESLVQLDIVQSNMRSFVYIEGMINGDQGNRQNVERVVSRMRKN